MERIEEPRGLQVHLQLAEKPYLLHVQVTKESGQWWTRFVLMCGRLPLCVGL